MQGNGTSSIPRRPRAQMSSFPSKGSQESYQAFLCSLVFPEEWGFFFLGAIMMLIGVAGTPHGAAADSVAP